MHTLSHAVNVAVETPRQLFGNEKPNGILIIDAESGHCCNKCTRLRSIHDGIAFPCSIESNAVVPSRVSNLVVIVLVMMSLVQREISIGPSSIAWLPTLCSRNIKMRISRNM